MNQDKFKKSLEDMYKVAKTGITKEHKDLILSELDEMAEMLEGWKAKNSEDVPQKKAYWNRLEEIESNGGIISMTVINDGKEINISIKNIPEALANKINQSFQSE